MPETKYPVQGQSIAKTLTKGKPVNREYIVSESWSQATVITREYKLGMMIDPTDAMRKFDFRSFGDQFFVRKTDSMEVQNQIKNEVYQAEIEKLRAYYQDFSAKISDVGKQEVINKTKK
jgi:hypothetical protein